MANQLMLATPVTSYLQGQQATQQNQLAQQQQQANAFALQQQQQQAGRDDQFRNALGAYLQGGPNALAQLYSADPQKAMEVNAWMQQQQQQQQVIKAKQAYIQAQGVVASKSPAKYMQVLMPDIAQQWAAHHGKSPDDMTDDDATQLAQQTLIKAGAQAGIEPQKPIEVPEGGTLLDPTTKDTIYSSPAKDSKITPYQQAELGISRARLGLETQKAKAALDPLGLGSGQSPGATGPSGEDLLKTLPPRIASQVKALSEGRLALPASFALKTPYWQQMLDLTSQYDPSFDQANAPARAKTRADFTSGKSSKTINNLNTAIGHAGTLLSQIPGTAGHSGFPFATTVNAIQNSLATRAGNPGVPVFKDTAGKLAEELTSAYRGGSGAEKDVVRALESLDENQSTETKVAIIKNAVDLLQSKMDALGDTYNKGMGTTKDGLELLNPHAQKTFQTLSNLLENYKGGDISIPKDIASNKTPANRAHPADIQALLQKYSK